MLLLCVQYRERRKAQVTSYAKDGQEISSSDSGFAIMNYEEQAIHKSHYE